MILNPRNCGDDRTGPGTEIEVIAIDDLGVNPDLIYLDVQGDELGVLEGAAETLERCKPVVALEHDRKYVAERGDAAAYLSSLGYTELERYGQDRIFSTRPPRAVEPKSKYTRKFFTKDAALAALRRAPDGVSIDLKRMTWRHKNGSKTHFVVTGE